MRKIANSRLFITEYLDKTVSLYAGTSSLTHFFLIIFSSYTTILNPLAQTKEMQWKSTLFFQFLWLSYNVLCFVFYNLQNHKSITYLNIIFKKEQTLHKKCGTLLGIKLKHVRCGVCGKYGFVKEFSGCLDMNPNYADYPKSKNSYRIWVSENAKHSSN